jgi:hypothetical protein
VPSQQRCANTTPTPQTPQIYIQRQTSFSALFTLEHFCVGKNASFELCVALLRTKGHFTAIKSPMGAAKEKATKNVFLHFGFT